ncbi:MAG TPA: DUF547 domain-containing protein [Burkholderiales bacterium]|nr:DUF547 domain-containing protein [Burkholderiales bacterium]
MKWRSAMSVIALGALIVPATGAAATDPYLAWAAVLERHVNERGEVDFRGLAADRGELDAFLAYVARVSPRSAPSLFPGQQAKLAYYLNAYNALAMFNVLDSGFPERLGALRRVAFFGAKRFTIGGERLSLYTLENDVIRPLGEERVHFALNCMAVSCPRLPREPFRPERLDQVLDQKAREFFAERRNLEVLPERRRVRVSSILKFYRDDFLAKSPALISYINRYVKPPIPPDYDVEFIDYDWAVNDQHRSRGG